VLKTHASEYVERDYCDVSYVNNRIESVFSVTLTDCIMMWPASFFFDLHQKENQVSGTQLSSSLTSQFVSRRSLG